MVDGDPPNGQASIRSRRCADALGALDIDAENLRATELDRKRFGRGCEVVVVAGTAPARWMRQARARGIPIVFLSNDTPFETQALSSARMDCLQAARPVEFVRFEKLIRDSEALLQAADHVLAPSPFLVERAVEAGKKAFLVRDIPTTDLSKFPHTTMSHGSRPAVRWLHYFPRGPYPERDLTTAAGGIARLMHETPALALNVEGPFDLGEVPELAALSDRVTITGKNGAGEALDSPAARIAAGDIVIDPAEVPDIWSDARGVQRFSRIAALGIPFVASPSASYRNAIANGESGFLCESADDWHTALGRLLSDAMLYDRVARTACEVVREGFTEALQVDEFGQCFETVLGTVALHRGRFVPLIKLDRAGRSPGLAAPQATEPHPFEVRSVLKKTAASATSLPEIDVSVVLDDAEDLRGFADHLLGLSYPPERLSLLISTTRGSAAVNVTASPLAEIRNRFARIVVLDANVATFAAGHNRNFENGCADFFLMADRRIRLEREALTRAAIDALSDMGDIGAWQFREKPFESPYFFDPVTLETVCCSARCQLFRRSAFDRACGFDETCPAGEESTNIALRLRKAGQRLRYNPAAVVWIAEERANRRQPSVWTRLSDRLRRGAHRGRISSLSTHWGDSTEVLAREVKRGGADFPIGKVRHPERMASIIVRVHGRNRPICAEALTTLANQTYPNLEVLVVEDAGTFCLELSEKFRAVGLTIRHIVNAEGGRARSANIGLAAASGDYLGFLDYDDLLMPDHVETLVQALEQAPNGLVATARAWAIHTHYRFCASDFYYRDVYYREFQPDRLVVGARELEVENVIPIQAAVFRREAYERLGGMDEGLAGYEDWELWRRYATAGDFIVVPKMTSLFRFRGMGHHNKTKVERQKRAADEIRKRHFLGPEAARGQRLKDSDPPLPGLAL